MELYFHNLLLGVLAVLLPHLVPSNEAYNFSNKHGFSIINESDDSLITTDYGLELLNRKSFPPGFTFGLVTSAYQVEGAWNVDGKGPSIWDNFTHTHPERIKDRSNADDATRSYYQYKEDVQLLKDMNMDAYRFSISWSRVLPNGRAYGCQGVNQKGIDYYNNLIDEIIAKGMKPWATLFYFDIPHALEVEYGGLLNQTLFVRDFYDYAELMFQTFGDRVKHWITINGAETLVEAAYNLGIFPPNRCSRYVSKDCFGGDSGIEPYIVAHNLLLAHASVVDLYKTRFKDIQKGEIGISLPGVWAIPYADSWFNRLGVSRFLDFNFGWFLSPIMYGYYPSTMISFARGHIPTFSWRQSQLLRGSADFVGLSYYTAEYVSNLGILPWSRSLPSFTNDMGVNISYINSRGQPIGQKMAVYWQYYYPQGIYEYLNYIKNNYGNPVIYITQNGASEATNFNVPLEERLKDNFRIKFHFEHLSFVKKAIDNGVNVKGYFAISLLDSFEWLEGYTVNFGFVCVDRNTFKRYPKNSAEWFKKFLVR